MLARGVTPDEDSLAYLTPHLQSADLALANLESPLTNVPEQMDSPYVLCAPTKHARFLAEWGLDLLSLANNHRLDCGEAGLADTRAVLDAAGLMSIGPGFHPVYRLTNGVTLAFLAFDDVSAPLDAGAAAQAIRAARAEGALVVVSIHWGAEYQGGASERQKSLAHEFAEAGAVLVWGHHPHVLQPAEWIETSQGRALVLYSLGNALFDQHGLADTRRSALVLVVIGADGIREVRAVPFVIDAANSRLIPPDAHAAEKILELMRIP